MHGAGRDGKGVVAIPCGTIPRNQPDLCHIHIRMVNGFPAPAQTVWLIPGSFHTSVPSYPGAGRHAGIRPGLQVQRFRYYFVQPGSLIYARGENEYRVKTAILGGGLSGLMVARLLEEKGEEVVVLEKEGSIGGLCRSVSESGFTFDTGGSHILFSRDEGVLSLMRSLLGPNQSSRERDTRVLYKGRYIQYPFENGLAGLPKEDLFLCLNEYIHTLCEDAAGRIPAPANFREWMVATFGKGIADCYLIPYNEKIWNCPPEEMSAHWVRDRIPRPPPEDIIRSAIGIRTEGYSHQAIFSYPVRGGIEALIHEIARPLRGPIRTGFTVREVLQEGREYHISDGHKTIIAERVISTIPLQALIPAMKEVPQQVTDALSALRYTSLATVSVGIRGTVPPYSWVYIPDRDTGLPNRISFPSNYSTEVAPPGCSSVLAEITWNEGDEISRMDDQDLASHVTGMLSRLGITREKDVVYTRVDRTQFAYVVYTLEYSDAIRTVREFCNDRGVILTGRFARFEYLNMDGCIRNAIDTVGGLP